MSESLDGASFPAARILVADDDPQVRSILTRLLTLLGYRADEADSGAQALEMMGLTAYDVAVLDIRMPGLDGVEVMRRCHQMQPDLAVILLTGYGSLETAVAAVKEQAVDYLLKPVSNADLADAVARALQWRGQRRREQTRVVERFLQAGPVTLDREQRVAIVARPSGDVKAELTASETALLAYLMQQRGRAVSCQELARAALVYDVPSDEALGLVRPHLARLRKKIETDPARPRLVRTVPGKGYVFAS